MEEVTEHEKRTLGQKFLEFRKMGLESYGKYLANELANSANSTIRDAYIKYIKNEITLNNKNIEEIDAKLK